MKSFLDQTTLHTISRLESCLPPYVLASVKIKMQDKTKILFLEGLLSIRRWLEENKQDLLLLNNSKPVDFDGIIQKYVEFLNSLRSVQCQDVGIDSKPWEWFVTGCKDIVLQIDTAKLIQLEKLAKLRKEEIASLRKKIKNSHIPLDVTDPELLYSLIRRDK